MALNFSRSGGTVGSMKPTLAALLLTSALAACGGSDYPFESPAQGLWTIEFEASCGTVRTSFEVVPVVDENGTKRLDAEVREDDAGTCEQPDNYTSGDSQTVTVHCFGGGLELEIDAGELGGFEDRTVAHVVEWNDTRGDEDCTAADVEADVIGRER